MYCYNVFKVYINVQVVFFIDVLCKYNIYILNLKYVSGKFLFCIDLNFDEFRYKIILKFDKF